MKDVIPMNRKTLAAAFPHTVPVLMGYLSIGEDLRTAGMTPRTR